MIKTSCENCVFRTAENGCALNRLEKFNKNGAEVIKENDHNVVTKRYCSALRPKKWADKQNRDLEEAVRIELVTKFVGVILISAEEVEYDYENLQAIVDSYNNQFLLPTKLLIIINQDIDIAKVLDIAQAQNIPFQVERIVATMDDGSRLTAVEALDIGLKKMEGDFYCLANRPLRDWEYFANIDEAINDNLDRFVMLIPDSKEEAILVNLNLHQKLTSGPAMAQDDLPLDLYEKMLMVDVIRRILLLSEYQNSQHLIKGYKEICTVQ